MSRFYLWAASALCVAFALIVISNVGEVGEPALVVTVPEPATAVPATSTVTPTATPIATTTPIPFPTATATAGPTATSVPTPTPEPTATSVPPTPTAAPEQPAAAPAGDCANPAYNYHPVQVSACQAFEHMGAGHLFVRITYFEGFNASAQWRTDYVTGGDGCIAQINGVHDDKPNSAIRVVLGDDARWPDSILPLENCLAVAVYIAERDGFDNPWIASRVRDCYPARAGCVTGWATSDPIYRPNGEQVGP